MDRGLTEREQVKLSNILSRLASPFEGERAAAALLANAFVTSHGLTWSDVTTGAPHATEPDAIPAKPPGERRRTHNAMWRGYCRRQVPAAGPLFSRLA